VQVADKKKCENTNVKYMLREDFFNINHKKENPVQGDLLVAEPFLHGKYFGRSVILLTEVNDKGAVGFVLNKEIQYVVGDFFPDLDKFDLPIFLGGPMNKDKLFILHTLGNLIPQSVHVKDNLYWGGDFETLTELIKQKQVKPHQVRFFVGYSGWTSGQLDVELEENSWVVSRLSSGEIMNTMNPGLWEKVMRSLGGKYKVWANFPENPNMN